VDSFLDALAVMLLLASIIYPAFKTSRWDLSAFRDGITLFELTESFPYPIPRALMGKRINTGRVTFEFVADDTCLLMRTPSRLRGSPPNPLLQAEIRINQANARLVARFPRSLIISYIVIFPALARLLLWPSPGRAVLPTLGACAGAWGLVGLAGVGLTIADQRGALQWGIAHFRDYVGAFANEGAA
jgi:hypothetical protein